MSPSHCGVDRFKSGTFTVKELLEVTEKVTGRKFEVEEVDAEKWIEEGNRKARQPDILFL